jgi:uracil phosphoribosyltransferase
MVVYCLWRVHSDKIAHHRFLWKRKNSSCLVRSHFALYVQDMMQVSDHSALHISTHPLASVELNVLRDRNTSAANFREALRRLSRILTIEATASFSTRELIIPAPSGQVFSRTLSRTVTIVPVLRAGLGMVDGVLDVLPAAQVGHLGLYRDEATLQPVPYYEKLPDTIPDSEVLLLDPMLATGGSANEAIRRLREAGAGGVHVLSVVVAPEGLNAVEQRHPDIQVYAAALDSGLDERGYIVPGLGDAGDRLFGT